MIEPNTITDSGPIKRTEFFVVCDRPMPGGGRLLGDMLAGPFNTEADARAAMGITQLPPDALSPLMIGEHRHFR